MVLVIYYKDYLTCLTGDGEDTILIQNVIQARKNGWIEVDPDDSTNIRPLSVDEKWVKNLMIFKFPKRTTAHKFVEVFKRTFQSTSDKPICILYDVPLKERFEGCEGGQDCNPDILDIYDSYCGR